MWFDTIVILFIVVSGMWFGWSRVCYYWSRRLRL